MSFDDISPLLSVSIRCIVMAHSSKGVTEMSLLPTNAISRAESATMTDAQYKVMQINRRRSFPPRWVKVPKDWVAYDMTVFNNAPLDFNYAACELDGTCWLYPIRPEWNEDEQSWLCPNIGATTPRPMQIPDKKKRYSAHPHLSVLFRNDIHTEVPSTIELTTENYAEREALKAFRSGRISDEYRVTALSLYDITCNFNSNMKRTSTNEMTAAAELLNKLVMLRGKYEENKPSPNHDGVKPETE